MDKEIIVESLKAVQEGSKLGRELVEKGSDLTKWIGELVGLKDGEILGLISDKLQFFRWERQRRMANKYNEIYGKQPMQPMQPIPPKFLIPILENGSLEEDDDLQDLWINLLGAFTNKDYKEEKRMAYVDILKNLSSRDVYFFNEIYEEAQKKDSETTFYAEGRNAVTMKSYTDIEIINYYYKEGIFLYEHGESIDNLIRLGCVKESKEPAEDRVALNLTYLGAGFVEACLN